MNRIATRTLWRVKFFIFLSFVFGFIGSTIGQQNCDVVGPLLKTHWDQEGFYNDDCPYFVLAGREGFAGCISISMAQLMKYWEHPMQGQGSNWYICVPCEQPNNIQSINFGSATYNWDAMEDVLTLPNSEVQ